LREQRLTDEQVKPFYLDHAIPYIWDKQDENCLTFKHVLMNNWTGIADNIKAVGIEYYRNMNNNSYL